MKLSKVPNFALHFRHRYRSSFSFPRKIWLSSRTLGQHFWHNPLLVLATEILPHFLHGTPVIWDNFPSQLHHFFFLTLGTCKVEPLVVDHMVFFECPKLRLCISGGWNGPTTVNTTRHSPNYFPFWLLDERALGCLYKALLSAWRYSSLSRLGE